MVEKLYKSESAKLLAVLTRIFGPENIDLAEDVLQDTFKKALTHWKDKGQPTNPAAWLMQTAKNRAIDLIRNKKRVINFAEDLAHHLESEWSLHAAIDKEFSDDKIQDDQLRMMFMCCRKNINQANQIPLMLKMLCGFSITATSRALLISEATVKKRLLRTKQLLKTSTFEMPSEENIPSALNTVHTVLYLLFNEGFHSSTGKEIINRQLCLEAIGLVKLVTEAQGVANRDSFSLLALLHFHMARIDSRLNEQGSAIPIDLQNRGLWDREKMTLAQQYLKTAAGMNDNTGRFFFEALIAQEHCRSSSFENTNWQHIVIYYSSLIEITQSPVAMLNQAIAFL